MPSAAADRRTVAMQAVIVVVLLASAQAYDGSIHSLSHWVVLGAYATFSLTLGIAESWAREAGQRNDSPASARLAARCAWTATILNAAVAIYFELEHMLVGAHDGYGAAAGAVSRLPAFLLLLQTALAMRVSHTAVFSGLVASVWGTALGLAWLQAPSLPLGPQVRVSGEAPAFLTFLATSLVVIDGTRRLRHAVATAIRLERERAQLVRFVPVSVAARLAREGGFGEARERSACLLAVDIRGFSRMTRERSQHEVVRALLDVRGIAHEAISAHDGLVDKYVGDGILAQFFVGRPSQQAEAALAGARAILERLAILNRARAVEGLPPLHLALALHAGTVLAGVFDDGSRAEFTVLGPAMNMLTRLEIRAKAAGAALVATSDFLNLLPARPDVIRLDDAVPPLFAVPPCAAAREPPHARSGRAAS